MDEVDQEVVVQYCLTGIAMLVMFLRLVLRKYRKQKFELGDYLTMLAIFSLMLRDAVIHVALVWGTNNLTAAQRAQIHFTPEEIYRREIGSKLTIVNRAFYCVYTWLQKCVVMCVLQRLLSTLKSLVVIRLHWAMLAVTFIVSFAATFVDCHPFVLYYQVVPNPGTCSKGNLQLLIFSVFNMLSDALLIILPLPDLVKMHRPFWAKVRLILLFLVGLTIIAVTLIRLLMNATVFNRSGDSHDVANVELFFEAFVANAPTIYGLLRIESRAKSSKSRSRGYGSYFPSGGSESETKTIKREGSKAMSGQMITQTSVVAISEDTDSAGRSKRKLSSMLMPGTMYTRGNESDEEMMIEMSKSASTLHSSTKSRAY